MSGHLHSNAYLQRQVEEAEYKLNKKQKELLAAQATLIQERDDARKDARVAREEFQNLHRSVERITRERDDLRAKNAAMSLTTYRRKGDDDSANACGEELLEELTEAKRERDQLEGKCAAMTELLALLLRKHQEITARITEESR